MTDTEHKMAVRIPKELHKAAKVKATESEIALSEVVRRFLAFWVAGEIELPKSFEGDKPPKSK